MHILTKYIWKCAGTPYIICAGTPMYYTTCVVINAVATDVMFSQVLSVLEKGWKHCVLPLKSSSIFVFPNTRTFDPEMELAIFILLLWVTNFSPLTENLFYIESQSQCYCGCFLRSFYATLSSTPNHFHGVR